MEECVESESRGKAHAYECEKSGGAEEAAGNGLGFWPVSQMPISRIQRPKPFDRVADRAIELVGIAGETLDDDRQRR